MYYDTGFHHCGGSVEFDVRLVPDDLSAKNISSHFHCREDPVKLLKACLSATEVPNSVSATVEGLWSSYLACYRAVNIPKLSFHNCKFLWSL